MPCSGEGGCLGRREGAEALAGAVCEGLAVSTCMVPAWWMRRSVGLWPGAAGSSIASHSDPV
eukprot:scaffold32667_cov45-Phaeocystis_antarctica.AAC.2